MKRLGATVLVGDEARSPIPTHMAIEVTLDRPYLVDVGFGDTFIRPLPLDSAGPHDGGIGGFGFVFDDGTTTLLGLGYDGSTERLYRFKGRPYGTADFDEASHRLQTAPGLQWTASPFATRLLDRGPDRVTLLHNRIKFRRNGVWSVVAVEPDDWAATLDRWFGMVP